MKRRILHPNYPTSELPTFQSHPTVPDLICIADCSSGRYPFEGNQRNLRELSRSER